MRVEVKELTKQYYLHGHAVPVLDRVSLTLEAGELVSVTGASGVGKSTLLHVIGTLDEPSAGCILYDGVDIFSRSAAEVSGFRNRNVGFVFQFHHLLPEFTALENTMMPSFIKRTAPKEAERRARELLGEVGLSHRLEHRTAELSGGEQQRVALARALMNEPRLLLADEPTGNLDEKTGAGIHEILARLNRERGITVVVVTHNERLAATMPRQIRLGPEGIDEQRLEPVDPPVPPATPAAPHTAEAAGG